MKKRGITRICFVTTVPCTIEAFVLDTAKFLYKNGNYEITFICDFDENFFSGLPNFIKYFPIKMKRGISFDGIVAIYQMYKLFKHEKFDLVQYSTPNASLYASVASKLADIPVRLYCQWGIVYVGFKGFKRLVFKCIEKIICALSTWIEPDSYGNLRFAHSEKLYSEAKSSVVWNGSANGVNLSKFNHSNKYVWRQEIRDRHQIDPDTFVIGFIGRLSKDKGINELLTAFKLLIDQFNGISLMLVGSCENPKSINKNLYEWSLKEKKILYCGFAQDIEKHYATMDIFVLPSYREGFGNVVIEAQAMGLPVIVTNIPGPTDAMINNETGLIVKKKDIHDLAEAIKTLYLNVEIRKRMSKKAIAFVAEKFESKKLLKYILEDRNRLVNEEDNLS